METPAIGMLCRLHFHELRSPRGILSLISAVAEIAAHRKPHARPSAIPERRFANRQREAVERIENEKLLAMEWLVAFFAKAFAKT